MPTSTSHYLIASSAAVRPYVAPGYTTNSYVAKRWKEFTAPIALLYNFVLPFTRGVNTRLEDHIAAARDGQDPEDDLLRDAQDAAQEAGVQFLCVATTITMHTGLVSLLLRQGSPVCLSVVRGFDSYQRLHFEYVGRVLERMYLPKRWASLLGAAPLEGDVEEFEQRPLSVSAAAEDAVKRHVLFATTELVVGTVFKLVRPQLLPASSKDPSVKEAMPSLRKAFIQQSTATSQRYVGVLVGAVVGSRLGGGSFEYWGEMVGSFASTVAFSAILQSEKKKSDRKASQKNGMRRTN